MCTDEIPASEITTYLTGASAEATRAEQLFTLLYDELRGIAKGVFQDHHTGNVLQPTALVHEIWLKLSGRLNGVTSLDHFLALAARAMRQILTDQARNANRIKRGGDRVRVTLDEASPLSHAAELDLIELTECLQRLEEISPRAARVTELRLFGSLPVAAVAELLDLSEATVKREWRYAKAWMLRELEGTP